MSEKNYNPSALMSAYNYAKHYGTRSGMFDSKRVDRALGYLMSGAAVEKWDQYETAIKYCRCPDSQIRGMICKHMISRMIDIKHDALMNEFTKGN